VSSSTGPQSPRPSCRVTSTLVLPLAYSPLDGHGWLITLDPLISDNPRASRPLNISFPRSGRRLVEEEGPLSKKTWQRKTSEAGELLPRALPPLLVKTVLVSPTKTNFTRSLPL